MIHNTIRLTFHPVSCCQGWWGVSRDPDAGQRPGPMEPQIKAEPALSKPHWLVAWWAAETYKTSSPTQELRKGGQRTVNSLPPNLHAIIKISLCIWMYLDTNNEIHTWLQMVHDAHLAKGKYLQSSGLLDVPIPQSWFMLCMLQTHEISSHCDNSRKNWAVISLQACCWSRMTCMCLFKGESQRLLLVGFA